MIFKRINNDGFSIVAVLVASALLGLLAIQFSSLITSAFKGQKGVQNAVDFDILKSSVNLVLNSRACDGAFKKANGSLETFAFNNATIAPGDSIIPANAPVPINKIVHNNSTIAEINQNLGGAMTVSELEFTEATYEGLVVSGGANFHSFTARLKIAANKSIDTSGGSLRPSFFSVGLLLAPTATGGRITRCKSSGDTGLGYNQTWQARAGLVANVPYQNTGDKPIMVNIGMMDNVNVSVSADGMNWLDLYYNSVDRGPLTFILPIGHFYRATGVGVSTVTVWNELK